MVQDYYKNPVIGSSMLMFHKPDKDLKMNFKMDPYDEHMDEKIKDIRADFEKTFTVSRQIDEDDCARYMITEFLMSALRVLAPLL